MSALQSLRRQMGAQRGELARAGFVGFLASFSAVALMGVSGWLIATAAEHPPVLTLSVAAVLVRALAIGRALFRYVERLLGHDAALRSLTTLRVNTYRRLEALAPTGLTSFGRGDLLSRLVVDVDAALDLPLRITLPWVQAVLVSLATVSFLVLLLPWAGAFVAMLCLMSLSAVPAVAAHQARRADRRIAPARAHLADGVVCALDGASDAAACQAVDRMVRALAQRDDAVTRLQRRSASALGAGDALSMLMQGLAVAGVLTLTVPAVVEGRLAPVWLAVSALLPLALFDVLAALPTSALARERLMGSAERLAELCEVPVPRPDPPGSVSIPSSPVGIQVKDIRAQWCPPDGPAVTALMDVSLEVHAGQCLAVVGPSGAGKSTLASVLLAFLPYTGSVTLNGTELSEGRGDAVRRQVGLLAQRPHVFDTSVAENLRIADPLADDELLNEVLARVALTQWCAALPDGMRTRLTPVHMSGGERQRLALARLLLSKAPVVILDEPTEHLDPQTADEVGAAIMSALGDRTRILITHRMLDAECADRIVELQSGFVTATGTHADLMAQDGWYAEQWRMADERRGMASLMARVPEGIGVRGPYSR